METVCICSCVSGIKPNTHTEIRTLTHSHNSPNRFFHVRKRITSLSFLFLFCLAHFPRTKFSKQLFSTHRILQLWTTLNIHTKHNVFQYKFSSFTVKCHAKKYLWFTGNSVRTFSLVEKATNDALFCFSLLFSSPFLSSLYSIDVLFIGISKKNRMIVFVYWSIQIQFICLQASAVNYLIWNYMRCFSLFSFIQWKLFNLHEMKFQNIQHLFLSISFLLSFFFTILANCLVLR